MKAALVVLLACALAAPAFGAGVTVTLKEKPNIECPGLGAPGGFEPRELDADVTKVMNLVTEEWFGNYNTNSTGLEVCDDYQTLMVDACSQIVSGAVNWQSLFTVTCPDQPGAQVNIKAYLSVPTDANKAFTITKLGVFPGELDF